MTPFRGEVGATKVVASNRACPTGPGSAKSSRPFFVVAFILMVVHASGWWRLTHAPVPKRFIKVALLQGNIDQYQKWDAKYEADICAAYESLAMRAAEKKPDVIIWPESAVPAWFPNNVAYYNWVRKVVVKTNTSHIVGAVTHADTGDVHD